MLHFPKGKWIASLEVVWLCHRNHPKGLVSGPARRVQSNAVMIFAEWERLYVRGGEGGEVPVLTHKGLYSLRTSSVLPSDSSRRALEKYWFGQSQPSTDGEVEFSIEKS